MGKENPITRRSFLAKSTAAAAATLTGPFWPTLQEAYAYDRPFSPDKNPEYFQILPRHTTDTFGLPMDVGINNSDRIAVIKIQKELNNMGAGIKDDGAFGPITQRQVQQLQERVGLPTTGIVDKSTWEHLMWKPIPEISANSPRRNDRRIIVDQRRNWVWLADGQDIYAQFGIVSNPEVPPDIYHVDWKVDSLGDATSSFPETPNKVVGNLWLINGVEYRPNTLFHPVPVDKTTGQPIHWYSYLGTGLLQSHDCLRTSPPASATTWQFATLGMPVEIYREV